jgi:hypothetical protein
MLLIYFFTKEKLLFTVAHLRFLCDKKNVETQDAKGWGSLQTTRKLYKSCKQEISFVL